jgi:hypothetical protein
MKHVNSVNLFQLACVTSDNNLQDFEGGQYLVEEEVMSSF